MAKRGMGWMPDYPDFQSPKLRDSEAIARRIRINQQKLALDKTTALEGRVDDLINVIKELQNRQKQLEEQLRSPGLQSVPSELSDSSLLEEMEQAAARRIYFLASNYEDRILCWGMKSARVEELQQNLKTLGYYQDGDRSGYFGTATEVSVRQFQSNYNFSESGIVSPVMWAELTALTAIATNQYQTDYRLGPTPTQEGFPRSTPGILYLQQQLQQLNDYSHIELTCQFDSPTIAALKNFQPKPEQDCFAIDPGTREELREALKAQSDPKVQIIPFELPLSARTFEVVQNSLYDLFYEEYGVKQVEEKEIDGELKDCLDRTYKNSEETVSINSIYESRARLQTDLDHWGESLTTEADSFLEQIYSQQKNELKNLENTLRRYAITAYLFDQFAIIRSNEKVSGLEEIKSYLKNFEPKFHIDPEEVNQELFQQRISPIVEVVARLIQNDLKRDRFLNNGSTFEALVQRWQFGADEANQEVLDQIQPLVKYFWDLLKESCLTPLNSTPTLKAIADWIESSSGMGYFSSFPFPSNRLHLKGHSGSAIIYLQELLRARGYYSAPMTGVFEKLTEDAVRNFQKAEGLTVDGYVGIETRTKLMRYKQEKFLLLEATIPSEIAAEIFAQIGDFEAVLDIGEKLNALDQQIRVDDTQCDLEKLEEARQRLIAHLHQVQQEIQDSKSLQEQSTIGFVEADKKHKARELAATLMKHLNPQATLKPQKEQLKDEKQLEDEQLKRWKEQLDTTLIAKQLQQLGLLYTELCLYPLILVVSQLIAPIGAYRNTAQAVTKGLRMLKHVAQQAKLEAVVPASLGVQIPAGQKPMTSIAAWKRQFRAFVASRNLNEQAIALTSKEVEEFQPLVEEAINRTFARCSELLKDVLKTFLYQDLIDLLEDFQQSFQWQKQTLDATGVDPSLPKAIAQGLLQKIRPSESFASQSQPSRTSLPVAERTFVQLSFRDEPTPPGVLQTPVVGILRDRILELRDKEKSDSQKYRTIYLGLPEFVDLSQWCSAVRDQGSLDACTAYAGVALTEFFEKKSTGKVTDLSSRFLYKVTRRLMQLTGDSGASIRKTMEALVYFGVPPEPYCPYVEAKFDDEPDAFCYAFAQNYQTISYFRLDDPMLIKAELLAQIKTVLAAGFPCMFGFSTYDSLSTTEDPSGNIPVPNEGSEREGGHAAIAIGYNDFKSVPGSEHPGAFLIKNSWGTNWGNKGYGWLPYDYVLQGLAQDWWSMIKAEWVEKSSFGLGFWDADTSNFGGKTPPPTTPR